MTKRDYRAAQQAAPIGAAGIEEVRKLVAARSLGKVNETAVDLFTASVLVQVHDLLSPANRATLLRMTVRKACLVALRAASKARFS
jgi:hypothetical protein